MGISIKRIIWSALFSFSLFGTMGTLEQQVSTRSSQSLAETLNEDISQSGLAAYPNTYRIDQNSLFNSCVPY